MKDTLRFLKHTILRPSFFNWLNILFFLSSCCGLYYATIHCNPKMVEYEKIIFYLLFIPLFIFLAHFWPPLQRLFLSCGLSITSSLVIYKNDLARSEQVFLLKYFLSSQSAILWMSIFFLISMFFYWVNIVRISSPKRIGTSFAWLAIFMGLTGLSVRWYESYLVDPSIGHIPFSNLYEVLILFCLISSLFYLFYEEKYRIKALGALVFLAITAVNFFLMWYAIVHDAGQIQSLMPALDSWWMKIHVPANFVGYGTFFISGMAGFAYIIKFSREDRNSYFSVWFPLYVLGSILCLFPLAYSFGNSKFSWYSWILVDFALALYIFFIRKKIAILLPSFQILEDLMYRSICIGFFFFSIAIVLGALWASDAWGMYWQWDPKETWSLIVWLNYASWLHARLTKGLRGPLLACWSLIGFLITSFAFLGVNIFLSGLHSYGNL